MSTQLLIATTNRGKRDEIASLLSGLNLVFPDQLDAVLEVEETGNTYAENALLKARAYVRHYGLSTLADDTGLEVDALGGNPGLHSARYLPIPGATDADRRTRLITELSVFPRPWRAHFVCAVAIVLPDGMEQLTYGSVEGEIQPKERGMAGFGYDRLFFIPEMGKTMAELSMEEKNTVSHRARAVKAALPWLQQHGFLQR